METKQREPTEIGDKAEVTIKYAPAGNASTTVAPVSGIVTCVAPEAKVGTPMYKASDKLKIQGDDKYAKFYEGGDTGDVSVSVGGTNKDVFFCATELDNAKKVISYDSYVVTSENTDVMSVSIEDSRDRGKYCRMAVTGNKVGKANIIVEAIMNGVGYFYKIPVNVVAEKTLTGVSIEVSKGEMSNAIDVDYFGTITVKGKYSDGTDGELSGEDYTVELVDKDKESMQEYSASLRNRIAKVKNTDDKKSKEVLSEAEKLGASSFAVSNYSYTAWGAKGQTYTLLAKAADKDGKEFTARAAVKVNDLPEAAWNYGGNTGVDLTYVVEVAKELDVAKGGTSVARLAAYASKNFAGYVRQDVGGATVIGTAGLDYEAADPAAAKVAVGDSKENVFFVSNTNHKANNGITFSIGAVATDGKARFTATLSGTPAEKDNAIVTNVFTTQKTIKLDGAESAADAAEIIVGEINSVKSSNYEAFDNGDGSFELVANSEGDKSAKVPDIKFTSTQNYATVTTQEFKQGTEGSEAVYAFEFEGTPAIGDKFTFNHIRNTTASTPADSPVVVTVERTTEDEVPSLAEVLNAAVSEINKTGTYTNLYTAAAPVGNKFYITAKDKATITKVPTATLDTPQDKSTLTVDKVVHTVNFGISGWTYMMWQH